jgi:hypothetical protein
MIPFIREFMRKNPDDEFYAVTHWPEIWMVLHDEFGGQFKGFVEPAISLRTQRHNLDMQGVETNKLYHHPSTVEVPHALHFTYPDEHRGLDILQMFSKQSHIALEEIDFQVFRQEWEDNLPHPLSELEDFCVMRFPSIRKEWPCEARNAAIKSFQTVLETYEAQDFPWVFIGFRDEEEEEIIHPSVFEQDASFHFYENGELSIPQLFALMRKARLTVASPSFAIPMCCAAGGNLLCLMGGYLPPEAYYKPLMGDAMFLKPIPFCFCGKRDHQCLNKQIGERRIDHAFVTATGNR